MLVLFAILIFVYHFAGGFYLMMQVEPSPTVEFLYVAGSACAPVWWVKSDTRRSAASSVYCTGLLLGVYWSLTLPYHLLKTRGWKGLLPLLVLIASYLFSQVLVFALYFALIEQ
jgi:hypothetical protein